MIPKVEALLRKNPTIQEALANPDRVRAELCRRSYAYFVKEFWNEVVPDLCIWNWHMDYLCSELEKVARRVFKRLPKKYDLIINIPPGTSKSTIVTIMFPVWCWINDPTLRFIAGSHNKDLSLEHADFSRDLVRSDKFKRYFPNLHMRKDKENKSNYRMEYIVEDKETQRFYTRQGGNRLSTSVGAAVTGHHAHILLVDDPLDPKKAASEVELKTANTWIGRTLSTRKVNKKVTPTILIMQRLAEDDCTGHMLAKGHKQKKIRHICLPGSIPVKPNSNEEWDVSPEECRAMYSPEGLLDAKRHPWSVLLEMEEDLGQFGYAGQVGQAPTPPEGGMFKVTRFTFIDSLKEHSAKISKMVRYWDKAATENKDNPQACWTVGCLMALMTDGSFVILDVVRGQWGTEEREKHIRLTAETDKSRFRGNVMTYLEQEPGSGGKDSIISSIKNLSGHRAYADKPQGDKIFRADPYSVQVNNHNFYLVRGEWNAEFVSEHRFFPFSKFKDQVDAASGAFGKLYVKKRSGVWGKVHEEETA